MRILLLAIFVCGHQLLFATDYVFTGNGDYSNPANWAGGLVPPSTLSSSSTITINGMAVTAASLVIQDLERNTGIITIAIGGSLTLNNGTQFANEGSIIVNGTFISNTTFEAFPGSSITISGTYNNQGWIGNDGTITINGGIWNNAGTLDNTFGVPDFPGEINVNCGGSIANTGIFKIGNITFNGCSAGLSNSGTLSGNALIMGNLSNAGILSPGNSPGLYTVTGNYTATGTASHNFEIAGTSSTSYDRLDVTGVASLNGSLHVSLLGGFVPSGVHDLTIVTANSVSGTFSSVNLPSGYAIVYNSNSVTLRFGVALPVTLTQFTASAIDNSIQLNWEISFEENNAGFYVEKSNNGHDWSSIGFIAGHGNSSIIQNYSFIDLNPYSGVNYYRLKQNDLDGNSKYSIVVSASIKTTAKFIVYPNPATDKLYFAMPQTGTVSIFNISGQKLLTQKLSNNKSINISKLTPGEYLIQLHDKNGIVQNAKFFVAE